MVSDDERREVARRLRGNAVFWRGLCCSWWEEKDLASSVMGDAYTDMVFSDVLNRLADLIEPHERTCHNISASIFEFTCSECHAATEKPNDGLYEIGYLRYSGDNLNYCPNCGARIMEVD